METDINAPFLVELTRERHLSFSDIKTSVSPINLAYRFHSKYDTVAKNLIFFFSADPTEKKKKTS